MAQLTYSQINRDLLKTMRAPGRVYYLILTLDLLVLTWGIYAWSSQIRTGMGLSGKNDPVGWALYISTFVFWIGIAHSGTLISAILFLFRSTWRNAIYRTAEAMTVFALLTAGLFPIIHLGRPWLFYWLLPYPQRGHMWINFRSPLTWDVFAVGVYLIVSAAFFFTGLVPDLAVVRDQATGWRRKLYGFLAQGWGGTNRQWRHYTSAYLFLAALATALVISVHSIIAWDFAMSIVPGWHSTIFAPYFVAGAMHSGLAMVLIILIPLRRIFRLEAYITRDHLASIARLLLLTALIMAYAYTTEFFIAWYNGNIFEKATFLYRAVGDYAPAFWITVVSVAIVPLLFVIREIRRSIPWLLTISTLVVVGMWFERFVIVVGALAHDYIPFSWGLFQGPTWVELGILAGSFAWFFLWFLLFAKLLPVVSITEVKELFPPPVREEAMRWGR
jgi:molybdopterin-containing oxidoreductase family membrane subunit